MKLGGIELDKDLFGGYELVNEPASSLPQELATAFASVNASLLGATYVPIWYVGHQLVNGTNHMLICREIRATKDVKPMIVAMVINIPPTKEGAKGEGARVVKIVEEAELTPALQTIFDTAEKGLVGVSYKPVAFVGKQVVRGINYYFICEAKRITAHPTPYAVLMGINVFEGQTIIVSIEQIEDNQPSVNAPLGEWP